MYTDRHPSFKLLAGPSLLLIPLLLFHPTLDLWVADFFWSQYPGYQAGPLWSFVYHWGVMPGLVVGSIALALLLLQTTPKWQKYRTGALMAFSVLLLGPGLLVNQTLKDHWERPRPIQLERYGGKYAYRPLTQLEFKMQGNKQKSFPSGHASMGFYLLCLWRIAAREGKRRWARRAFVSAIALSTALGWARMAQGGHFLSDVLISGYIVWLAIIILERYCYGKRESRAS